MIVKCTNCNTSYSVDDSKVNNKKFGFTCPNCSTNVIIDNKKTKKQMPPNSRVLVEDNIEETGLLDDLSKEDFGFDEDIPKGAGGTAVTAKPGEDEVLTDLEFNEPLDIPSDESLIGENIESGSAGLIDLPDLDEMKIDADTKAKTHVSDDDDLSLDLDSLDIPLEEAEEVLKTDDDSDITIDLDSLDIPLEEMDEIAKPADSGKADSDQIEPLNLEEISLETGAPPSAEITDDDSDITIDLDSLDIPLEEMDEIAKPAGVHKDAKIISADSETSTEDIEIKTEEAIYGKDGEETGSTIIKADDDSPEISDDLRAAADEISSIPPISIPDSELGIVRQYEDEPKTIKKDDALDLESKKDFPEYDEELEKIDEKSQLVPGGAVNFSIDYSFKHSVLAAIARILMLYPIVLMPHFIVSAIYAILSSILSSLNWLLILFTGKSSEDYLEIQENSIRYLLSIGASACGVVDDLPVFTGRKSIDHPIQYNITYPVRHSRVFAFLRLTVAGIFLITLPHIILLTILSLGTFLISFVGMFSLIIMKRWPGVLYDFMVRYYRYLSNVYSFLSGLVDRYPSFRFD